MQRLVSSTVSENQTAIMASDNRLFGGSAKRILPENSVEKYFVMDFNFHHKIFLITTCKADYFGNVIRQLTNVKTLL